MKTEDVNAKNLWEPSQEMIDKSNLKKFMSWLENYRGIIFEDYQELWEWSITEIEKFWTAIWDYYEIIGTKNDNEVLFGEKILNVKWFPGAKLNYAEHVFRNEDPDQPAVIYQSEIRSQQELSWAELKQNTAAIAQYLKSIGIKPGDRVVSYAPNIHETLTAFLACASIGAVWSSCAPEFGIQSVIDRFKQIKPKVLFAIDGYQYSGKQYDRLELIEKLQSELPSLQETIIIPYLQTQSKIRSLRNFVCWDQLLMDNVDATLTFESVPFDHPLWILYSSGTTGKPKGIVQSQGGILLEHLKFLGLQCDIRKGDRFFWYTTTGWMMWNITASSLLTGATVVLFDGNPSYPNNETLWRLAESTKMTTFGTSASFLMASLREGVRPKEQFDLSSLRGIGSTGSPLPESGFQWVYENVKEDVWLYSASGGTDICSGFVGGCALLPVRSGELQARSLGVAVRSFSDFGEEVKDEIGELVVTKPMPSMPIYFWNDESGERYKESYFNVFPDIWRHGDFIKITSSGSAIIYGRSDATINRGGVRMGTSEIYSALDPISEVVDSLIVDIPISSERSYMPLFIVLKEGSLLTEDLGKLLKQTIVQNCSPRHVPDEIIPVEELPKTLNGKKIEVPIKKILMGIPIEQAVNLDSLLNPETLQYFVDFQKLIKKKRDN